MKTPGILAVVLLLSSSALAQTPGFFVSAAGGEAWMDVGHFVVYNGSSNIVGATPNLEALPAIKRTDRVSVSRLTVGCRFDENWGLQFSYADYGTGEVGVTLANDSGLIITPPSGPPIYTLNVLKYKPTAFTLGPSFTYSISNKWQVRAGAGASYSITKSHYVIAVRSSPLGPGGEESYPGQTDRYFGYFASLGVDYLLGRGFTVGVNGNFSSFKAKVPASPWVVDPVQNSYGAWVSGATSSRVNVRSCGIDIALTWHW
jgi:hypothetical protein